MKTTIIKEEVLNKVKLLTMKADGVSNIDKMFILTQVQDTSKFNTDDYFGDDGIITGCSYISAQYSYGSTEVINQVLYKLISEVSEVDDLLESDDELMETYFIVFDAGNGKSLLVSNYVELFMSLDIDSSEFTLPGEKNIVCGSIADDNDISTIITYALTVMPKTKGFKVPGSDFFEMGDEALSFSDFEEYQGSWFSDVKSLKNDLEWYDFFKAINKLVVGSSDWDHGYNINDVIDDVDFIIKQYESCQKISDDVKLVYKHENSHKFYDVMLDNNFVQVNYGGVGKPNSNTSDTGFDTIEEARAFLKKKVISKVKSGYVIQ